MNTSVRARRDARGFSFVELLVTIIIAGIAFAAIVPLFVMAAGKNVDDNFRTSALTLAQDKLERIRQLDYTQIVADKAHPTTLPNLYNGSPSFSGGQFGSTWTMQGGGSARTLYVDYVVTPVPAIATGIQAQYKEVQVTVTWDAPPVVKPVVLKTIVYKQYAGPTLLILTTVPEANDLGVIPGPVGSSDNNPGIVTLRAVVDQGWINQTEKVQFAVAVYGGATVASGFVKLTDAGYKGGGVFEWPWDATTEPNGVYDLKATAISGSTSSAPGFAGNTIHIYPRLAKIVVPDSPTGLTATNGNGFVTLEWDPYAGTDLLRYELYKSEGTTPGTWVQIASPTPQSTYTDYDVTNGNSYWYAVKVVTTTPLTSDLSTAVPGLPSVSDSDSLPPSAPAWISCAALANTQTIQLAWQASTDYGAPPTGVGGYRIWRSADQVTWTNIGVRTDLANLSFSDPAAGYNKTWFYKVQPYDKAVPVNATDLGVLTASSATTGAQPKYKLTVQNTSTGNSASKTAYVWVQNATSGKWVNQNGSETTTRPQSVKIGSGNGTGVWSGLYSGPYSVYVGWGQSSWSSSLVAAGVSIDNADTLYPINVK